MGPRPATVQEGVPRRGPGRRVSLGLGLFLITVLPMACTAIKPPIGSANHEAREGAEVLYTRDRYGDWNRQRAYSPGQEEEIRRQQQAINEAAGAWRPPEDPRN